MSVLATLLLVLACSCTTIPDSGRISGKYACKETRDVLMFRPDGHFYYTFGGGLQPFKALYSYDESGRMRITVMVSTHSGYLKDIRPTETKDRLLVRYADFAQHGSGEYVFERIDK